MEKEKLEFALIASLIRRPNLWGDISHDLTTRDFDHPLTAAMVELLDEQMRKQGVLSSTRYIALITKSGLASAAEIQSLLDRQKRDDIKALVKELRQTNTLIAVRETLSHALTQVNAENDPDKAVSIAQSKLIDIFDGLGETEFLEMQNVAEKMHEQQNHLQVGKDDHLLHWNTYGMTNVAGPLEPGSVTIIAARTSMGKTAFTAYEGLLWAKNNIAGVIFSMEQDAMQIGERWAAATHEIPADLFLTKMDPHFLGKFNAALSELTKLPVMVSEKRGLTVDQICSRARMAKMKNKNIRWMMVDYLTLITTEGKKNYTYELGDAVRKLRDLSKEINVALLLVAQLNRGVDARDNKRPTLSDLRDSGNIEEFSDRVVFLYREGYYKKGFLEAKIGDQITEIIIAKNRRGEVGNKLLSRFNNDYMRFEKLEDVWSEKYRNYVQQAVK